MSDLLIFLVLMGAWLALLGLAWLIARTPSRATYWRGKD